MYKVIRVDSKGFYIEDILVGNLENLGEDIIIEPCAEGFHLPKWNGAEWVEGRTEEELSTIRNEQKNLEDQFALEQSIKEAIPGRIKELELEKTKLEILIADLTEIVLTGGINEQTSEPI